MKSFHVPSSVNTASVTMIGFRTGTMIERKMRNSLAPSIRAASMSSSGIDCAYCRTRKMPKMLAIPGTITPPYEFTRPICFSMRKSGTIATCPGTTNAPSSSLNKRSRPKKRSLANA